MALRQQLQNDKATLNRLSPAEKHVLIWKYYKAPILSLLFSWWWAPSVFQKGSGILRTA